MKKSLLLGLIYGIGCGAAAYLGYMFGYQEAELKNERILNSACIATLSKCKIDHSEDETDDGGSQE